MNIGFLITARLKSSRLKFKILKDLNGYTVIERIIHRAKEIKQCKDIVLCTSKIFEDLPLVRTAKKNNIFYFNGNADDVLQRLLDAAELFNMDYFIGITADNPLFSIYHGNLISEYINSDNSIDYIYTTGMPIGLNIYGIKTKALKVVCEIKRENDTEIWGNLINQPSIFNVKEICVEENFYNQKYRLTLDEIDDYNLISLIYKNFPKDDVINILDVYKFLEQNPQVAFINKDVIQRDLDFETKLRISNLYKTNIENIIKIKKSIYSK